MPRIQMHNIGEVGIVKDTPSHTLPLAAWSDGLNVRFDDGSARQTQGYTEVFNSPNLPLYAPEFAMAVPSASSLFWLYTSLTKAAVYEGGIHTDVTRVSGDYAASEGNDWNGGVLGGVAVINNGTDVPQYWPSISVAVQLEDLSNWPSTLRAQVVRPFRNFLIALNVTDSGTLYPHRVRWSHSADPGTIPDSWNIADPTKDAGEVDLTDVNAGVIRDGQILRDLFVIYKDDATHVMRFIGGGSIFQFQNVLTTSGILAARCAAPIQNGKFHFVHTGDDLIVFSGSDARSVLDKRWRKALNAAIDSSNFANSFCFDNPTQKEAGFAYPSSGAEFPNRVLLWNYEENTIAEKEFLGNGTGTGIVEQIQAGTWDADTQSWDLDGDPWARALRRQIVVVDATNTKFYQLDEGDTADGTAVTSFLERTGLALTGQSSDRKAQVDFGTRKLCKRIWPKVRSGKVNIQMGSQEDINGSIVWQTAQDFDPLTQTYLDFSPVGRLLAVRFANVQGETEPWVLDGYDLEVEVVSVL